ncbi:MULTISPECIES: hypothetical protein [Arsenicicoccus]|uniref:hypothetical protein n=1 Tax=Arsenicicoccus TaxID=267408 RepID=UPI0028A8C70E|nr:hypothetical protein [Arsenicicoccus bolidensis]
MTDDDTTGAIAPATAAAREVLSDLPRTMRWQEDLYQDLHRHPELSLQETRTNRIIADRLAHWGYDVLEAGAASWGCCATVTVRACCSAPTPTPCPSRRTRGSPTPPPSTA